MLQGLLLQQKNPYSDKNENGIINAGVAENTLALSLLTPHFNSIQVIENDFKYGELCGSSQLRQLIAELFNRHLSTQLSGSHLSLHNGCGSTIENLVFNICDLNDEIMIAVPFYGGFEMDLQYRMGIKIVQVPTMNYRLTMDLLEETYAKHSHIKAFLLCNPENPTALCRTIKEIELVIEFCNKHSLHLISDEIYALTAFNSFYSIFHPKFTHLINKNNTHLVWSFSKDFCMNGIRVGVYASLNPLCVQQMHNTCYFSAISRFADLHLTKFLTNTTIVDAFLVKNKEICLNYLQQFKLFCNQRNIRFIEPNAGFYLYINLSKYIVTTEYDLFLNFINIGVYMPRGEAFNDNEQGWFRVTYALKDSEFKLLLSRLSMLLD